MKTEAIDELRAIAHTLLSKLADLELEPAAAPVCLLTFEETGQCMKVGRTTVQELVDSGELPVVSVTGRAVRVDTRDVEAFVKRKRERR